MRSTKLVYGNCLLGGMYLCLRGKAKKVGFVSSHAWYVPAHIVVETKNHNILHFKYAMEQNPLYFKGSFEGVKSSEIFDYLEREDRKIIHTMNPSMFLLFGLFCFLFLLIPWTLYWPCEVILWRIPYDIIKLVKRCINRLAFNNRRNRSRL